MRITAVTGLAKLRLVLVMLGLCLALTGAAFACLARSVDRGVPVLSQVTKRSVCVNVVTGVVVTGVIEIALAVAFAALGACASELGRGVTSSGAAQHAALAAALAKAGARGWSVAPLGT